MKVVGVMSRAGRPSCTTLAFKQRGKRITTVEGLERDGKLHPVQAAFIEHDGFQRGAAPSRSGGRPRCWSSW